MVSLKPLPKNAREYVHVGLGRAIPGAPRFRKGFQTARQPIASFLLSAEIQNQTVADHLQDLDENHQ